MLPASIDDTAALLHRQQYFADRETATVLYLALRMQRPLFLEGEPGVGKTALAQAMAAALGTRLPRLQCYEGLDAASALYEWDYPRQIMALRLAEARGERPEQQSLYHDDFLLKRPLLEALLPDPAAPGVPRVLLIDEIDRADEPFEAFLLEVLSEYQVSIPEIGVVRAERPPLIVVTSNRTREVCTTRSSGAASTSGWATRTASASWRSWPPARPRQRRHCSIRRSTSSTGCAASTCSRRPALPRRSTGAARWPRWA